MIYYYDVEGTIMSFVACDYKKAEFMAKKYAEECGLSEPVLLYVM